MKYLTYKYKEVESMNINEFRNLTKRNDKMHYLRKSIKSWKVDFAAKNEFYEALSNPELYYH